MMFAPLAYADAGLVKKALAEKMPGVQIRSVEKSPYAGLYEVVASGFTVFYTDEKAEIGIFNSMIESPNLSFNILNISSGVFMLIF